MLSEFNYPHRLPAEWEPCRRVLIAWPHAGTDWAPMLDQVTECYVQLARAIMRHAGLLIIGPDINTPRKLLGDAPTYVEMPTNDTWTRDYGPISFIRHGLDRWLYDFGFNGWGLKFAADHDNQATRRLFSSGHLGRHMTNRLGFILEGGSIESDGLGNLLTTTSCLMSPNRNPGLSQKQITGYLQRAFSLQQVLWLNHGAIAGDDTDGHIDTLARFAPDDTILFVDDPRDPELALMRQQLQRFYANPAIHKHFNLVGLPVPDPIYDDDGDQLPATYANFLVLNDAVLMPAYGQPRNDELAAQTVRVCYPDHVIEQVDCRPLIQQHGSLHCATMQLYC